MLTEKDATECINRRCYFDEDFKNNVEILDKYDFSEFLSDGVNLWALREAIEDKYDKEFKDTYHMYVFDHFSAEDTCHYFCSRYNVRFQEYRDWVVRHENGAHEKARRRT